MHSDRPLPCSAARTTAVNRFSTAARRAGQAVVPVTEVPDLVT